MKRVLLTIAFVACGLAATSGTARAQAAPETRPAWLMGGVTLTSVSHDTVASSKYQEYRDLSEGIRMPEFFIKGNHNGQTFSLVGKNVTGTDQRYTGRIGNDWFGLSIDYNQIPHSMGNNGHSILTELGPGVWSMSPSLRQSLQNTVMAAFPTTLRTYPFYADLWAPTIASAGVVNLNATRERGNVEVKLGGSLPFDLVGTYMREVKRGTRGAGGGYIRSFVDNIVEVPEPLNEVTQDVGLRGALNRKWGNIHASFNHNTYNDRQETLVVANPLVPVDQPYIAASGSGASAIPASGGSSRALFINPPDNAANTFAVGGMLKFARQTRISTDISIGRWTQNAQLYPYTIFSFGVTGTGAPADQRSSLQMQSLNGQIHTTTANVLFSSRPFAGLGVRARFRRYDFANKTPEVPRIGSFSGSPDRLWSNTNLTTDPLGYATADPYGYTSDRYDLSASYDIKTLTVEAAYRDNKIDRTFREASVTKETGTTVSAILRTTSWLNVRASFDNATRKPSGGVDPAVTRLPSDEMERHTTRSGLDVEVSPVDALTFVLSYSRRNADYKNPDAVAGVAGTAYGLVNARYDTYTAEIDLAPSDRAQVNFYYTREKNRSITQSFSGGTTLLGLLNFAGSDQTKTYGLSADFKIVPEKWAFRMMLRSQNLDGLMDVTGDPNGSFALARATIGGIQDINDYSDTKITTASAEIQYTVKANWDVTFGMLYEKYDFSDAFSFGAELYPLSGAFYLKANDGGYKANMLFTRLNYRF